MNGWLNIYKPSGITSFDVIRQLKRVVGKGVKIGHAGTLDPLAEGVLPIALGNATKFIAFAQDGSKTYECTIQWGIQTDTDDVTGKTLHTSEVIPSLAQIQKILPQFTGEILQMPPIYSALKVAGKAAYAYAREGQEVELAPRVVAVHNITVIPAKAGTQEDSAAPLGSRFPGNDTQLRITCGKGTYIRSIARDMGIALGTYGTIKTLKRTIVGPFKADTALDIFQIPTNQAILQHVLPVDFVLDDILAYPLSAEEWQHIAHGRSIPCTLSGQVVLRHNGDVVALGQGDCSVIRPHRVIGVNDVASQSSTH